MKKIKTFLALTLFSLTLSNLCLPTCQSAASVPSLSIQEINLSERVNEVVWKYRTYNGKRQKRLWSVTYQKWLSDWVDV